MITRVRLRNWKAYDGFDIDLTSGTTFLVAANGVGKSSFVDAVRWALDPNAKASVGLMRRRSTETVVTIDLRVGTADVEITRSLTKGRGATPTLDGIATIDGDERTIPEALEWIAATWNADPLFLHRSAFLTDRLLLESGEPDLEDHLVRLYSLDELRHAQTAASDAADQLAEEARNAKRQTKTSAAELEAAEQETAELLATAEEAGEKADTAAAAASTAADALTAAQEAKRAAARLERWESDVGALQMDIEGLLGDVPPEVSLNDFLQTAEAGARAQFVRETERRAALRERVGAIEASLARLHDAESECPVCRRPLDDQSRGHAEEAHEADRSVATNELALVDPDASESAITEIVQLRRRLDDLGSRPEPSEVPVSDLELLAEAAEAAAVNAATFTEEASMARAKASVARERTLDLASKATADDTSHLYEQMALLTAGARALERAIDEVLTRQIGPLRDQVNRRWEALFPDRPGLQLDRTGKLARTYDDDGDDLPFSAFSSGEKVIAKILMRLTTITETTGIPLIWIDEPLEHLDPTARVYVAETLALLTASDGIKQIVVTTYEDELARRLEGQLDYPVRLRVLRNTPSAYI